MDLLGVRRGEPHRPRRWLGRVVLAAGPGGRLERPPGGRPAGDPLAHPDGNPDPYPDHHADVVAELVTVVAPRDADERRGIADVESDAESLPGIGWRRFGEWLGERRVRLVGGLGLLALGHSVNRARDTFGVPACL